MLITVSLVNIYHHTHRHYNRNITFLVVNTLTSTLFETFKYAI